MTAKLDYEQSLFPEQSLFRFSLNRLSWERGTARILLVNAIDRHKVTMVYAALRWQRLWTAIWI